MSLGVMLAALESDLENHQSAFVRALESIKGYRDIFNGPEASFGPDKHQGASSSFLAVVKEGRWVRPIDPLTF